MIRDRQPALFDDLTGPTNQYGYPIQPIEPHTRARAADPETSKIAAAEVTRNGIAAGQADRCLEVLQRFPGKTSAELAALAADPQLDRFTFARRLPELERQNRCSRGRKRLCSVSGIRLPAHTWWPPEHPEPDG